MITLQNLHLARGTKTLFNDISLSLHAGQSVGLIGDNGTGKSSLFQLLMGELSPDRGDIEKPKECKFALLAQETPGVSDSALDYVLAGYTHYWHLHRAILQAQASVASEKLGELHAAFADIDGYAIPSKAATILHGLGFSNAAMATPVKAFSGGWRMRLNLARALLVPSDILLLDEPTNHLDIPAIVWLEKWIRSLSTTVIIISHDRDFLDSTVSVIWHLAHQQLKTYSGNYSAFERAYEAHLAQQQSTARKQQKAIAHMQSFVERFKAKASKARQAKSRLKAIERLGEVPIIHETSPFHFSFLPTKKGPHPLMELGNLSHAFNDKKIFEQAHFQITPDARIGLLGPNGVGKSTLINIIQGTLKPDKGTRTFSPNHCRIGYFAQHQLEQLTIDASPVAHIQRLSPDALIGDIRQFLGRFAFSNEMALSPITHFSGGEKARLALACLIWQKPNLLLLDEPTNHLDIRLREALALALQTFDGAMILISHDRHLLRTTVDEFYCIENYQIKKWPSDLESYEAKLLEKNNLTQQQKSKTPTSQKTIQSLKKNIRSLEQKIEKTQQKINEIHQRLADSALYQASEKETLATLQAEQKKYQTKLQTLEEDWLNQLDTLESLLRDKTY